MCPLDSINRCSTARKVGQDSPLASIGPCGTTSLPAPWRMHLHCFRCFQPSHQITRSHQSTKSHPAAPRSQNTPSATHDCDRLSRFKMFSAPIFITCASNKHSSEMQTQSNAVNICKPNKKPPMGDGWLLGLSHCSLVNQSSCFTVHFTPLTKLLKSAVQPSFLVEHKPLKKYELQATSMANMAN